jgi:hypothetical protein
MPGPGEPLWTAEDYDYAAQWQAELDSQCPGCGHPADQAWDRKNLNAYETEVKRCWACFALARRNKSLDKDERDGVYILAHHDPADRG